MTAPRTLGNWLGLKCRLGYCGGRPSGDAIWRCDECGKSHYLTDEDRAAVRRMIEAEAGYAESGSIEPDPVKP